jgi:hypothetical protein
MAVNTRNCIRHLGGAFCAVALLAGTAGMTSAEAVPQATKATAASSSVAPDKPCTGYHYDENGNRVWHPPGCVPPM